ncbi:SDR family NAD(P)-dependent oxidoreductase [Nonomuraea sp. NPDC026600]|uniref:SDR family NAD(P)-dependent oxidoreductase n=1 Tax=Nonomuraea sp. NPDC026600 TaxID=3155363 RepID=UPI003405765D
MRGCHRNTADPSEGPNSRGGCGCGGLTARIGLPSGGLTDPHNPHADLFALVTARGIPWPSRAAYGATITCISSAAGFLGVFGYGAYSPTKFAVAGLGEVLRQELRPHGITVTIVYPPDVDTPMLAKESPHKPPELRALSGGARALTPESVARAILAGTVTGRARVIPGAGTRALRLAAGAAPGLLSRYMDHVIRRAHRPAERQPSAG